MLQGKNKAKNGKEEERQREEVVFEQDLKGQGSEPWLHGLCKGPGAGACQTGLGDSMEASRAGAEQGSGGR